MRRTLNRVPARFESLDVAPPKAGPSSIQRGLPHASYSDVTYPESGHRCSDGQRQDHLLVTDLAGVFQQPDMGGEHVSDIRRNLAACLAREPL